MTFLRRGAVLISPLAVLAGCLVAAPQAQAAPADTARAAKPACARTLAAYPILRPGDRKAAVRTLQCSLNDVGAGPVVVDGFYGPQTKAAVKRITDGFEGTGAPHPYRINNGFWTLLFGRQLPDSNLAIGAHGPVVKILQRALRAAGATIVVDGSFGPQTQRVVKAYQREHHIRPANGVVNEDTRFFLGMGGVFGQLS
ncbi:peptidoglycan-binding domain-containing protein [Nocardioides halotolerans]|uniref:peptidoglycan-binding domain-containing protein n=1 Tax=Nocardioides halotolerans TaxID=433660 RepID=UPI00041C06A2|nr:peptidoglycan-binding protein [Nocardioides halotolerans]